MSYYCKPCSGDCDGRAVNVMKCVVNSSNGASSRNSQASSTGKPTFVQVNFNREREIPLILKSDFYVPSFYGMLKGEEEEDDAGVGSPPYPPFLPIYSPISGIGQTEFNSFSWVTLAFTRNYALTALGWTEADEAAVNWDNVTTFPLCGKTKAEIRDWLFPAPVGKTNTMIMRGSLQLWDEQPPFVLPITWAQVEAWNIKIFQLFRKLIGAPPLRVQGSLFKKVQWNLEYRKIASWAGSYPGWNPRDSILSTTDQTPYLQPREPPVTSAIAEVRYEGLSFTLANHGTQWMMRYMYLVLNASPTNVAPTGLVLDLAERPALAFIIYKDPALKWDIIFTNGRKPICGSGAG